MLNRRDLTTLIAGLASGLHLQAAEPEPRLRGFTENLPPLNYQDEDTPRGFSVELLRMVAAEAGLGLDIEVQPWTRAMQSASQTPNSVLFSLTRLPEREAQFQWVGPISERRIVIYKLASRTDLQISSLRQLRGARLGVVRDSAAAKQLLAEGLRSDDDIEWARDDATNLRKLLAGRMELIVLLDWAAAWNLRQLQLPFVTLTQVLEYDASKSYWFGLQPDAPESLRRRLQAGLDKVRRDGRFDALRLRYFS